MTLSLHGILLLTLHSPLLIGDFLIACDYKIDGIGNIWMVYFGMTVFWQTGFYKQWSGFGSKIHPIKGAL